MALVYSLCWDGNGIVPTAADIPNTKLAGLLQNLGQVLPDPGVKSAIDYLSQQREAEPIEGEHYQ
jgi:hypothetical protein